MRKFNGFLFCVYLGKEIVDALCPLFSCNYKMSLQEKIRNFDSKIGTNGLSIFIGIVFLIGGLYSLFQNPIGFINEQTMLYGNYGAFPVSKIISTLMGWTFLSYGILNKINFFGLEKRNKIINQLPFRKRVGTKNSIFILTSFIFILSVSFTFLIIRPDEKIRNRNEKFNKQIREFNELWERIQKEDEDRRLQNKNK